MMRFSSFLILATTALQSLNAFPPQPSTEDPETNKNEIPYGQPDAEITRTVKYVNFREDLDVGGLDPDRTDNSGWPMIYVQQGYDKAVSEGIGLDTLDLDGYVDGILSHKDLMWPYRAEIADLLKTRKSEEDGTITPANLFDAKQFTAEKYGMETPTYASATAISLTL